MDARSLWDVGIAAIGGATALIIALGWLITNLVRHLLDKNIDAYKIELKAHTEVCIRNLEFELRKEFLEHEVRFRDLYQRRSVAMAEIYRLITIGLDELERFLLPGPRLDHQERRRRFAKAAETILTLKSLFMEERLLFPLSTVESLEQFIELVEASMNRWAKWATRSESQVAESGRKAAIKDGWKKISGEGLVIKRQIERQFRSLMSSDPSV